jgi:hypothetical protein
MTAHQTGRWRIADGSIEIKVQSCTIQIRKGEEP